MSLTDLVIPPWVRIAALAAVVLGIAAGGAKIGARYAHATDAEKVATANRERDTARTELANYRLQVREAAAQQATAAAQTTIEQTRITQESAHAYIDHRGSLEQRIAAGGLRLGTDQGSAGGCRIGSAAKAPAGAADRTAQSVPADAAGGPGEIPPGVGQALPPDQLIEDAARDALQLADLIDTACRLGLCAEPRNERNKHAD